MDPERAYLIELEAIVAAQKRWRALFRQHVKQDLRREVTRRKERFLWLAAHRETEPEPHRCEP